MRPWVRIPSTPSMLLSFKVFVLYLSCEKNDNKRKRGREWPILEKIGRSSFNFLSYLHHEYVSVFVDENCGHDVRDGLLDDRLEVGRSRRGDPLRRGDLILEIKTTCFSARKSLQAKVINSVSPYVTSLLTYPFHSRY